MTIVLFFSFFLGFPVLNEHFTKVNKVERLVHNPVDLMVEVPRPVVIEKTIEVTFWRMESGTCRAFCILVLIFQVPKIQIEERTIKVPKARPLNCFGNGQTCAWRDFPPDALKVMSTMVDTVVQNQIETIEVVKPTVAFGLDLCH